MVYIFLRSWFKQTNCIKTIMSYPGKSESWLAIWWYWASLLKFFRHNNGIVILLKKKKGESLSFGIIYEVSWQWGNMMPEIYFKIIKGDWYKWTDWPWWLLKPGHEYMRSLFYSLYLGICLKFSVTKSRGKTPNHIIIFFSRKAEKLFRENIAISTINNKR